METKKSVMRGEAGHRRLIASAFCPGATLDGYAFFRRCRLLANTSDRFATVDRAPAGLTVSRTILRTLRNKLTQVTHFCGTQFAALPTLQVADF
jgi:hypothetical protein